MIIYNHHKCFFISKKKEIKKNQIIKKNFYVMKLLKQKN
jgi:hypothetical protein